MFSVLVSVRQPTAHHPDSGQACPTCEHIYARHEGVKTGHGFVFGQQEIARLFLRIGEGMSLRAASRELRGSVFRVHRRGPGEPAKGIRPGATSRQPSLAMNYLDAFAPAVIEALRPRAWPRVVILDAKPFLTRGYRPAGGPTIREPAGDADETRAGNLKAGTILIAMDPTGPAVVPCLMQVQGGRDTEAWKAFFAALEGLKGLTEVQGEPAVIRVEGGA